MSDKTGRISFFEGLTFGSVTILIVIGIALLNIFETVFKLHANSPTGVEPSLVTLLVYNPLMLLGFWVIYATRRKAKYYQLRLVFYAMLLTSVTVEVAHYLLRFLLSGH